MSRLRHYPLVRNSLPPEGIVFVVILGFVAVCAILRNVNLLVVVSGMMFAPLLLCWRLSRATIRNMVVKRILPNRMHAGQVNVIQWMAKNNGRLSAFNLKLEDTIRQTISNDREPGLRRKRAKRAAKGTIVFDRVAPGESEFSSYRVLFSSRGVYETGPAVVSGQYPLPLIKCWYRTIQNSKLYVAPQLGMLAKNWEQIIAANSAGGESKSRTIGPQQDEFFAIRKWQSGDNMRKIHWRSTAKFRQPMVKQLDRKVDHQLAIVLDLYANQDNFESANDPKSDFNTCEKVLSLAATLLANWNETVAGKLVLGIAGDEVTIRSSHEQADFTKLSMQSLATASTSSRPGIESAIAEVARSVSANTLLMVFSSRPIPAELKVDNLVKSRLCWVNCRSNDIDNVFAIETADNSFHRETRLGVHAGQS